jgi:hypothetical protein
VHIKWGRVKPRVSDAPVFSYYLQCLDRVKAGPAFVTGAELARWTGRSAFRQKQRIMRVLENRLYSELHTSVIGRSTRRGGDDAEGGGRADVGTGITENGTVDGVERLSAELRVHTLPDVKVLDGREVDRGCSGAALGVPGERSLIIVGSAVDDCATRRQECRGVKPVGEDWMGHVTVLVARSGADALRAVSAEVSARSRNGEWEARLQTNSGLDRPTTRNRVTDTVLQ